MCGNKTRTAKNASPNGDKTMKQKKTVPVNVVKVVDGDSLRVKRSGADEHIQPGSSKSGCTESTPPNTGNQWGQKAGKP